MKLKLDELTDWLMFSIMVMAVAFLATMWIFLVFLLVGICA